MSGLPRSGASELVTLLTEIERTAKYVWDLRARIARKHRFTTARWLALLALARSPYCLSISDLARAVGCTRQTAHQLAQCLERTGEVRLVPNSYHHHIVQLELTSSGRAAVAVLERELRDHSIVLCNTFDTDEICGISERVRALRYRLRDHLKLGVDRMR